MKYEQEENEEQEIQKYQCFHPKSYRYIKNIVKLN